VEKTTNNSVGNLMCSIKSIQNGIFLIDFFENTLKINNKNYEVHLMSVVLRYLDMFRLIPQGEDNAISTQKILERLTANHNYIDLQERTLQRDLEKASRNFPNLENFKPGNGNQKKWYWASAMQFPAMLEEEAIALKLSEMFVASVLPSTTSKLSNYFEQANQCLMRQRGNNWMEKITVAMPSNDYFKNAFAQIDTVFNAIIKNVEFKANYRNTPRIFNPQGLIFEIGSGLLITAFSQNDAHINRQLREDLIIHDINILELKNVELIETKAEVVFGFNLQEYIRTKYPNIAQRKIGFVK
jgi:hypothetical protein